MKVRVTGSDTGSGRLDLILGPARYSSFTEHDLRDIEFALAQRRAMTTRCDEEDGEHTCGLSVTHKDAAVVQHLCRGCTYSWKPPAATERTA